MRTRTACCAALLAAAGSAGCSRASDETLRLALRDYVLRRPLRLTAAAADRRGRVLGAWAASAPAGGVADAAAAAGRPDTRPAQPPPGGRRTVGPAYPGDFWRSFGRWAKDLPADLWDDTVATATNPWSLAGIAAAGATGIAIAAGDGDRCAARHYTKHRPQLSHFGDMVGDVGGNPGAHFAVAGAMLLTAMARDDVVNTEKSRSLINALALNGLVTLGLKGIVRTRSPNGDAFGWPSGHTSSSFCLATVMHEHYGPLAGVPLFAFATFVGYERVDARNHDLSDVVSGALLGLAIGHAVAQNHRAKILGMDVLPYANGRGVGLALSKQW
jgi:hypothetical protein